jgi:hypothetical protein
MLDVNGSCGRSISAPAEPVSNLEVPMKIARVVMLSVVLAVIAS